MIQRIQTLFLVGVAICMGMMLTQLIWIENIPAEDQIARFSPFSIEVMDANGTPNNLKDDTVIESQSTWYVAALAILATLTAIVSIFQFKNRLNQMKLGALNSLFMVGSLAACFLLIRQSEAISPETLGMSLPGFYFPIGALLLNMVANRFIRKDEKLVKSVDRIR